jgi:hypothetical protein
MVDPAFAQERVTPWRAVREASGKLWPSESLMQREGRRVGQAGRNLSGWGSLGRACGRGVDRAVAGS